MRHFAAAKPEFVVFGEELDVGVRRSALRDSLPLPAVFRRCVLFVQHHGSCAYVLVYSKERGCWVGFVAHGHGKRAQPLPDLAFPSFFFFFFLHL